MPKTKINNIDLKIDMQVDIAKIVMALVVLILILGGYMRADDLIKIEKDKATAQIELSKATQTTTKCECPVINPWNYNWNYNLTMPTHHWSLPNVVYVSKGG